MSATQRMYLACSNIYRRAHRSTGIITVRSWEGSWKSRMDRRSRAFSNLERWCRAVTRSARDGKKRLIGSKRPWLTWRITTHRLLSKASGGMQSTIGSQASLLSSLMATGRHKASLIFLSGTINASKLTKRLEQSVSESSRASDRSKRRIRWEIKHTTTVSVVSG